MYGHVSRWHCAMSFSWIFSTLMVCLKWVGQREGGNRPSDVFAEHALIDSITVIESWSQPGGMPVGNTL